VEVRAVAARHTAEFVIASMVSASERRLDPDTLNSTSATSRTSIYRASIVKIVQKLHLPPHALRIQGSLIGNHILILSFQSRW
jgi:hypothetical protein